MFDRLSLQAQNSLAAGWPDYVGQAGLPVAGRPLGPRALEGFGAGATPERQMRWGVRRGTWKDLSASAV